MEANIYLNILGNLEVCQLLIQNGADLQVANRDNKTAFDYAFRVG